MSDASAYGKNTPGRLGREAFNGRIFICLAFLLINVGCIICIQVIWGLYASNLVSVDKVYLVYILRYQISKKNFLELYRITRQEQRDGSLLSRTHVTHPSLAPRPRPRRVRKLSKMEINLNTKIPVRGTSSVLCKMRCRPAPPPTPFLRSFLARTTQSRISVCITQHRQEHDQPPT